MQTAKRKPTRQVSVEEQAIRVWSSGSRARKAGVAFKDCPFAKGSSARAEWESGWRSVDSETDITLPL